MLLARLLVAGVLAASGLGVMSHGEDGGWRSAGNDELECACTVASMRADEPMAVFMERSASGRAGERGRGDEGFSDAMLMGDGCMQLL
jgi:hypothetical protein